MNFLEAKRIVDGFRGGEPLHFLLGMSGTPDQLLLFVRAWAAQRGRAAAPRTLAFNSLGQALVTEPHPGEMEVFLLFPWDLVPEADWRTGLPATEVPLAELQARGQSLADRLTRRPQARLIYVPAPIPPLFGDPALQQSFILWLNTLATSVGAVLLPPEAFALGGYLASGGPIAGPRLGVVAEAIVEQALGGTRESCKVLVTDLDNVMWAGVLAEDGLEGIAFDASGRGYRHFIYQSFLVRLKAEGILLAAVSRNDAVVALAPIRGGRMLLKENDFVAILASYHAKSAQIRELAERLNLGLDAFVFVDDNPVELAEVGAQLPSVPCLPFPSRDDGLPELLHRIRTFFPRRNVTAEDRERTELYRRRLAGIAPSNLAGADLTGFLGDLQMRLTIHDRSRGDRSRAVQLINKTNQFNLNGDRVTDEAVAALLAAGGRLYGASLDDRHGGHGEILACLVTADGVITAMVLSCRVFQRRVEQSFLAWLAAQSAPLVGLRFKPTDRNTPTQEFLRDPAFVSGADGLVRFDATAFARAHAGDLALFALQLPTED